MAKLSVIMVNHNTGELAIDSLRRIRLSMDGMSGEIFFVDNGSTDGSVEAVVSKFSLGVSKMEGTVPDLRSETRRIGTVPGSRVANEASLILPDIKIIANGENLGFARAVNQGILKSDGDYILLINPDVTIHNNTLSQLINFMETFPDAGAVTPYITYPDGRRQDFCSYFPTLPRQFFQLTGLRMLVPGMIKRRFLMQDENKTSPFQVDWVIGACMVVRKKAMEDAGHLDEDFFMYGEDMDFCYRLSKNGWKVYVFPDGRTLHEGSPGDILRSGILKEPLIHHTTYLFFKKHHGIISAGILAALQRAVSLFRLSFWAVVFIASIRLRERAKIKMKIHSSCLKGYRWRGLSQIYGRSKAES